MTDVHLTPKELLIINLICKELTIAEIALISELAPRTVDNYKRSIQKKIGAKNIVGIAVYALLNGLIKSEEIIRWLETNNLRTQQDN